MRPEAGDVLVDQTMICEASRLLENDPDLNKYTRKMPWWPPTHTERLVHLSTLLDALALHEHLYVLKAELPDYADQVEPPPELTVARYSEGVRYRSVCIPNQR